MDKQEALAEVYWLGIFISEGDEDALICLNELKNYVLKERERKKWMKKK